MQSARTQDRVGLRFSCQGDSMCQGDSIVAPMASTNPTRVHVYEVRPRKDHRGVDLISDALPFGWMWYGEQNAISNAIS
jgi:hypothetical protein